jgi:hypothetical protein
MNLLLADRRKRVSLVPFFLLMLAVTGGWSALAQPPKETPAAPAPLPRAALLKRLGADAELRKSLAGEIEALGGKTDAVLEGTAPARPGEDLKDLWHQGATLTPRDPLLGDKEKPQGVLVVYNVFMHSLKECMAGNFLAVQTGPGANPYAAAGLYDVPGAPDGDHPWIVEVGFDLAGLKEGDIKLQVGHEPVPSARLGDTSIVGFARMGGGKHFVEITQPPADPAHKTRRFWYTRFMRL